MSLRAADSLAQHGKQGFILARLLRQAQVASLKGAAERVVRAMSN
jgi:hypothetical protein